MTPDREPLLFDEIEAGCEYASGPHSVTREEIVDFARRWDDRPWHVDEEAALRSLFGGLVACGAHVIAIYTRLSLAAQRAARPQAILAGLGMELRLAKPVRPGDALFYRGNVVDKRGSESRRDAGIVRTRHQLRNQRDELVFEATTASLVSRGTEPVED